MAGWLKKHRMGGNVQKLFEDKEAYGKAFHDKLFLEGIEEDKKKDKKNKDDMKECDGEVNRISQLMSPDIEDDDEDDEEIVIKVEDEDEEDDDSIEIEIEKEEDDEELDPNEEEPDNDEDDEEMEEGIGDSIISVINALTGKNPQKAKSLVQTLSMAEKKQLMNTIRALRELPVGEGGPFGSATKQEETDEDDEELEESEEEVKEKDENEEGDDEDEKEDDEEEMKEANGDALDQLLSTLGEDPVQNPAAIKDALVEAFAVLANLKKISVDRVQKFLAKADKSSAMRDARMKRMNQGDEEGEEGEEMEEGLADMFTNLIGSSRSRAAHALDKQELGNLSSKAKRNRAAKLNTQSGASAINRVAQMNLGEEDKECKEKEDEE